MDVNGALLEFMGAMRKLIISAIPYLNTAPLMWDFERGRPPGESAAPAREAPESGASERGAPENAAPRRAPVSPELANDFAVEYTLPALCAEALRAGAADIGIMPVAAYAEIPKLAIIPEIAIAACGPVRSILLVSKVPLEQVRTLAADTSSRTSTALARVLFTRWFGRAPEFVPAAPQLDSMLARCDAALIIGDPALRLDRSRHLTWDLAEEWRRLTGKPFVFAFWAARMAALAEARSGLDVSALFRASCEKGLEPASLAVIAREWAPRVAMSERAVVEYLTRNIHYALDEECAEGLKLFFRYAAECGAIPNPPQPFRFLSTLRDAILCL